MHKKTRFISLMILVALLLSLGSPSPLRQVARDHEFSFLNWQINAIVNRIGESILFWGESPSYSDAEASALVLTYMESVHRESKLIKLRSQEGLNGLQEKELYDLQRLPDEVKYNAKYILRHQLQTILEGEGIFNPFGESRIFFPPINFEFSNLPKVLVVSERGAFKRVEKIYLRPDITLLDIVQLEDSVEKMGFSALVVSISGISTYPTMVSSSKNQKWVIKLITHEWIHNYLFFTSLGWAESTDQRQAMEETIANIVGYEIAEKVWVRYYKPHIETNNNSSNWPQTEANEQSRSPATTKFDFNSSMREIRETVEVFLEQGKIDEAEAYMNERRDWLALNRYNIRKLNQAYFVFHGSYADSSAYSNANEGAGAKLLELRALSASLKEFLVSVSVMENVDDLNSALQRLREK